MKICQLLIPLRTQNSALGSEEERTRRKATTRESQLNLLELTRQEALKLLHEGQFEIAIPAALQSLKLSLDYYGNGALELVPAYLLLGEASIGLGRYNQAETYLSAAKWAVLKQPECPNRIKSQLHRIFGQLYAAVGNHDLALQQLANDVCLLYSAQPNFFSRFITPRWNMARYHFTLVVGIIRWGTYF